jgi:hypothetical protein
MAGIRPFATIAIFSAMTALDPLLTFKIGPMNEREARESGLWLKAWAPNVVPRSSNPQLFPVN